MSFGIIFFFQSTKAGTHQIVQPSRNCMGVVPLSLPLLLSLDRIISGFQSRIPRTATAASLGDLLETQISGPLHTLTELETLEGQPGNVCCHKISR